MTQDIHKHKLLRERLREVKFLSRIWFFFKKFRSYKPHVQIRHKKLIERGNYCNSFSFVPELLSPEPLVYSFGVGYDVSFDLALINEFNAEVFAFDPTPKSLQWAEKNVNNSKFHLYPYGISENDGDMKFYLPDSSDALCGTASEEMMNRGKNYIIVPMKRLKTIASDLGHKYIDLLKIDIEGTEFQVLPDILKSGVNVGQFCIEVHNRFYDDGDEKIKSLISSMNYAGYYIVSVSPNYEELTFTK